MKRSIGSKFFVLLALLYLYVPIVVLVVMGFNESRYNSLPFSFTLKWYQELAGDSALLIAARNSLLLALATGWFACCWARFLFWGSVSCGSGINNWHAVL